MFRHDKTFVNKTVIAIHLDADASDFDTKLEKIKNYHTERIGETFKSRCCISDRYKQRHCP